MAGFQQGFSRPQKENDKKPKSGLPRKRSRKAKNRNEHRFTRIGGGRFAAKSSRSPRDESLVASFRHTDRYGQKPHTETRQSAPGHAVPLPAGNAPKIGPHRAVRNSHPRTPTVPLSGKGKYNKGIRIFGCPFAESGGFEPPVPVTRYGSLANCWFQPLTQLSFHKGARLDRGTKLIHFYEIPNSRRIFSRFPRVDPLRRIRR